MKEYLNLFFKGIILGIGKILPGISGTILAITFGIYDKSIYLIANIKNNVKIAIKYLTPLALGIIISIIMFSKLVIFLVNNFYDEMLTFFIGLLIESSKKMYKQSKINVKKDLKTFIITILISITFNVITIKKIITLNNSILGNFFLGSIEALTSIVPGISGTSILILLNCYDRVILRYSEVLNIKNISETIYFFIPFIIGVVFNTIITAKIINKLINKNYNRTYSSILAIIITSIFFLLLNIKKFQIINLLYFCTGIFFYKIINKYLYK